jgi:hypothetical protein
LLSRSPNPKLFRRAGDAGNDLGTRPGLTPAAYSRRVRDPATRALEHLYAVPPGVFVEERKAAAAALKKAGHTAEAQAVLRLRKPSPILWVTNQLARAEPKRLATFLESVERVRRAQLRDPRAAGAALGQQRADLEALLERAGELLGTQGHRPTPDARRRVSNTLLGAAIDRRLAEDLRRGRLSAELPAPGFEALTGVQRGDPAHLVQQRQTPAAPTVRPRDEDRRKREEQERARRRREAEELAHAAALQQEAVERHVREVDELAKNLTAARERLHAARRAARTAAAAARKAGHPSS